MQSVEIGTGLDDSAFQLQREVKKDDKDFTEERTL